MVTAEEIAGFEVFATLDVDAQERLARAAADISLTPGEYAANAGDDRALYVLMPMRV